ncbi:MAG TPA: TadE family protein [Thermoleophilaceae bacterium]
MTARRGPSGERGGVLVMFALWLPILVLFITLVVDVANWFEHKRHLQLQADAAALAGGGRFGAPCDDTAITDTATAYGGATYNAQVGGTAPANVHMEFNSQTYFGQSSPVDSTVVTGSPCAALMLDVKMTETDLPWLFSVAKFVPFINAHARVSVRQIDNQQGALPVGVPDVNPKLAKVTFVDESDGTVLGSASMTRVGSDAQGNALWDNSGSPVPVTFQKSGNPQRMDVGVRVALSGGNSTNCTDPLVNCYDAGSTNGGLDYIRGYSNAGSGTAAVPIAREISFLPANGSCADPYFHVGTTACTVVLQAKVDFGTGTGNPTVSPTNADLQAFVDGKNPAVNLTYNSTTHLWRSNPLTIQPQTGPVPIELRWTSNSSSCGKNGKCSGTFGNVQRSFSGLDDRSGPIQLLQVWEGLQQDTNAFEMCSSVQSSCTHNLVVHMAIKGSLKNAADVNDPIVSLRLVGNDSNSSRNQSLDCDPGYPNLKEELAHGCRPAYAKNTGQACPGSTTTLWATAQPWNCVAIQTGTAINQVSQGMNERIQGSANSNTCVSPNNWSKFGTAQWDWSDPRITPLFLVPYGSFGGSGSGTLPVIDFAYFYVTGYSGQGNGTDPCAGKGDDPAQPGYIVGHFIKYVSSLGNSSGSTPCDPNAFGGCVVQLTE